VVRHRAAPEDWDASVEAFDDSSFCHLGAWEGIMKDVMGHETLYMTARDREGLCHGLLPLVRVRSRLFGDYLLSMPFMSYGGPVGSRDAKKALAKAAVAEAERLGVDLMELRTRQPLDIDLPRSDRKITVLKSLPDDPETLWKDGLKAKVRSQVRRPMKEGMEARIGTDLVDPFYDVFSVTMRDLGTPVLPKTFFEEIASRMSDQVVFSVVEDEGRPAAAGCGFLWKGEYEITWAGALRELSRKAPNMLLYWSLMEESVRRGASTFNFGRCSPGSGTHRFKSQWGTEDQPLPWTQWARGGVAATPSPDSAKFRLATQVWSRLPVSVTNRLGPWLSRSLP
jgi:serine/alanine adding enzyme